MTKLAVRTCNRLADVRMDDWEALTARPPASVIGSRPWFETALETVNRGSVPFLIAVQDADRLVGLMTLVLDERAPSPVLRFAGSPSNDLADLMTLSGHETAAGLAALGALRELAANGCTVELDDLDPAGVLAGADPDRRFLKWGTSSVAPTIDLCDRDAQPSLRQIDRWDRALGALRATSWVEFQRRDGSAMVEVVSEFIQLREVRLRALGRDLYDPPLALLEAAVGRLAPLGRCAFMEMTVDGTVVARDLYLLDGAVAMLWLRALDMKWLRHTCGHLLLRESTAQLAAEGYETLDLGRGGEPYKYGFGARERVLLSARLPAGLASTGGDC